VIIGVAGILVAADVAYPAFSSYFVDHAIVSGAVMSLLFLAIGYTVVEWSIRDAERRRWDRVKRIGLIAVGRGVLNQRRAMQYCVTLTDRHSDGDFSPHDAYARVEEAVKRSEVRYETNRQGEFIRSDSEALPGPQTFEDLPSAWPDQDLEGKLRHLVADEDWRKSAYHLLREAEHSMTRLIARWTPALSASQSGLDVLNCLSEQTDSLDDLVRSLGDRWETQQSEPSAPLERVWIAEQINALVIHERLMSQAKGKIYYSSARRSVPHDWNQFISDVSGSHPTPMRLVVGHDGSVTKIPMIL